MINPDDVPDVEDDEMLARFIVAGQSTKSLRKYVKDLPEHLAEGFTASVGNRS